MEQTHASWAVDELGPALVAFLRPCAGVEAVVVVDNVALGPAIGGVRMKIRDSTAELLDRLRHAPMTPRAAADQIASERLRRALALRRRF